MKRIQGKVLVVEDDAEASQAITSALEEAGYEVSTASDGVEGLKLATTKQPWLIVLDALLPGMDGLEVCSRLRSDGRTQEVPILMLSEKAREADRAVALRIGADDYLPKPVDPVQVVDLTQQLIVEKQGAHSRIVAFIGCKGGVGASTVAANVALCAAGQGIATLLLDPSVESKALPSILGLDASKGEDWMFDGIGHPEEKSSILATLIGHDTGLEVLSGIHADSNGKGINGVDVEGLLQQARKLADYVFIDMSWQTPNAWKAVLQLCNLAMFVTDSSPDGLDSAKTTASSLAPDFKDHTQPKGLIVVDKHGVLEDMEFSRMKPIVDATVGVIPLVTIIPHDLKIPLAFEGRGVPVTIGDDKRPAAVALRDLHTKIANFDLVPSTDEELNG